MAETKGDEKNIINHPVVKMINGYLVDYFSFIIIYVVLIIVFIGYFYVLNPKYKNIIKNNELHQSYKKKEITQLIGAVENYQNYKKIYDAIPANDKAKINSFLPNKDDSEELLIYIRNMMTRGGYKLLSLEVGPFTKKNEVAAATVSPAANKSAIKKLNADQSEPGTGQATTTKEMGIIDISLKVGGLNYSALKNFFQFVERDARFFDIENVDFSLSDGVADLRLKAYYLN